MRDKLHESNSQLRMLHIKLKQPLSKDMKLYMTTQFVYAFIPMRLVIYMKAKTQRAIRY